ncbi:equistatin-like [Lineus longissimus]|uniref:equistatin-like n=1 Tax=Lineus longissimus TaxID=88925 RepID=UPI002B4E1CC9
MWKFVLLACVGVVLAKGPCTQKNDDNARLLEEARAKGTDIMDLPYFRCEEDGTFARVQCYGASGYCYCAAKDGTSIGDHNNNNMEGKGAGVGNGMNCNCARDFYEYQQTGLIGKSFSCEDNGNYKAVQCLGSVCYCADELGNNAGNGGVPIGESDTLQC